MINNKVIIIPTLNPNEKLIAYVEDLAEYFQNIILVNDGSGRESADIFSKILNISEERTDKNRIVILRHAVNLGKGRALKTAINYYLTHINDMFSECEGIITVDSDGQHTIRDVRKISEVLEGKNSVVVLGYRNFRKGAHVPIKSSFGNITTRFVFRLLFGKDVIDTQTGLRGFANDILPKLLNLYGERFEYETNVLIECVNCNVEFIQIGIETIYEDGNKGTHFNPIVDSFKIYRLIFGNFVKYIFASISSFVIDCIFFLVFGLMMGTTNRQDILLCTIFARIISSSYNYIVNKKIVFECKTAGKRAFVLYFLLVICNMLISGYGVGVLYTHWGGNVVSIKIIVDIIIFILNYVMQQRIIFKNCKKV